MIRQNTRRLRAAPSLLKRVRMERINPDPLSVKRVAPQSRVFFLFFIFMFAAAVLIIGGCSDNTIKVRVLVEPSWDFDHVGHFSDGLAVASKDNKQAFINKTGKIIIPLEHDGFIYFNDGLMRVSKDGLMLARKNGLWGFIDTKGNIIVPFEYDRAINFSEGLAAVQQNGLWGILEIVK